jgi:hypothetical protein
MALEIIKKKTNYRSREGKGEPVQYVQKIKKEVLYEQENRCCQVNNLVQYISIILFSQGFVRDYAKLKKY